MRTTKTFCSDKSYKMGNTVQFQIYVNYILMGIKDQKHSCIVLFSSYLAFRASDLKYSCIHPPPLIYAEKTKKK